MNRAIDRIHLSELRSSRILHPEWSVTLTAALVGALTLGVIASFAFPPVGWIVAFALVGAVLGALAAGLANAEEIELPAELHASGQHA
jgi:hypothetical protein